MNAPVCLRPIVGSRRPEATAWILALILAAVARIAPPEMQAVWFGVRAFGVYFGASALLMSVGNWLERNTVLALNSNEISLKQPMRTVHLAWKEVQRLEVRRSNQGSRVFVSGAAAQISFRLLAEVKIRDKIRDRYGFEEGEQIVSTIIEQAQLNQPRVETPTGYYYAHS